MTNHHGNRGHKLGAQRGSVLWIFLSVLALGSSYFLVTQMNQFQSAYLRSGSDVAVLRQAIDGLIGYAITQARNGERPGSLPCPDTNGDGIAEPSCANANLVGRLPWKTLSLPELRDNSGALLWYALSSNFRNTSSSVINSDTVGQLSITDAATGAVNESDVIAVVFAPGAPVEGQTRRNTKLLSDYLEGASGSTVFSRSQQSTAFTAGQCFRGTPIACNDQLLTLNQADLFDAIEPVVADRLNRAIPNELGKYFKAWNRYPNPVPFSTAPPSADQLISQDSLVGATGAGAGWLPISRQLSVLKIDASSVRLDFTGSSQNAPTGISCSDSSSEKLSCRLTQPCDGNDKSMTLQFNLKNAGNLFFASTVSVINNKVATTDYRSFTPEDIDTTTKRLSLSTLPYPTANLAIQHTLINSGDDQVNFSFALPGRTSAKCSGSNTINLTLTLNAPSKWSASEAFLDNVTEPAQGDPLYWFHKNQWYRQTVYMPAPAYAPGGSGKCGLKGEGCFIGIRPDGSRISNIKVLLIFSGRVLAGQDRSTTYSRTQLSNYLEYKDDPTNSLQFHIKTVTKASLKAKPSDGGFNDHFVLIGE